MTKSGRISIHIIEQAMDAALKGTFTTEQAADLAATQFNGANRIKKAQALIGHFTLRNPLFAFLTSSLRHPKILIKEFSYFLMPCHQHGLRINLLV